MLLHRPIELALTLYTNNDGGLTHFISHYKGDYDDDDKDVGITNGGATVVHATTLARRLADMAQSSTQTLGGR